MVTVAAASSIAGFFQGAAEAASGMVSGIQSAIQGVTSFVGNVVAEIETIFINIGREIDELKLKWQEFEDAVGDKWDSFTGGVSGLMPGKRAAGGPVSAHTPYIVGEKGPEMFTPSSSGSITPNHKMGGGGSVFNMTFNLNGMTDRTDKRALAKEIAGLIQQETRLNMGTGKARGRYI